MTNGDDKTIMCCQRQDKCVDLAGAPTWRKGSIAPFEDMVLCNACGIFEAHHGKSLLECTQPVRVLTSPHAG